MKLKIIDHKIVCGSTSKLAGSISVEALHTSIEENMDIYCLDCYGKVKYVLDPFHAQCLLDLIDDDITWIGERASGNANGLRVKQGYARIF